MCLFCHACALRWGVTQVGNYHYWAIANPVERTFFQVLERSRRRLIIEVVLEESRVVALVLLCIHVLECFKLLIYVV